MSTPGVVEVRQPAAEGDNIHDIEYHEVRPDLVSPAKPASDTTPGNRIAPLKTASY